MNQVKNGARSHKHLFVVFAVVTLLLTVFAAMMPKNVSADSKDIATKHIGKYFGTYSANVFIYKGQYKGFCMEVHKGSYRHQSAWRGSV